MSVTAGDAPAQPLPGPAPAPARYPLFADTVQAPPSPVPPPVPPVTTSDAAAPTSRRPVPLWLLAVVALVVVALVGVGLTLLLAPSGDDDADDREHYGRDGKGNRGASIGPALTPTDVAVPGSAPASVDGDGDPVTFEADNMLDADPRTSWRMPGDGSGSVITFTFGEAVTVAEVGLINGYAKTDPPHDWYAGNRRIEAVTWVFDDGTEVTQELRERPDLQTIGVDAVETATIELRILEVTGPGDGPDGRDFTAISDVKIFGSE
ncbi:NADase-type glycan-binding domain-containing protein [Nocardioides bizhenqiangii]|uniref:NAD glycohydrolase translocation F5/8 type C domain-containing protein n=1 Tax=Nocardioides bizhenqiangii TaxID=3095076 RepID=A0ABZ0ZLG0_9ACTN|nr:hypothetical protein [Nocardioides sp. HM61]WQQ25038.1 hypothetical protein SHK19_13800 [Nocardioides sp. HM61]